MVVFLPGSPRLNRKTHLIKFVSRIVPNLANSCCWKRLSGVDRVETGVSVMKCELCTRSFDARKRKFVAPPYQGANRRSAPKRFCSNKCLKRWHVGWIPSKCH